MSESTKNHTVLEIGSLANLATYSFNGIAGRCFVGERLGLTGCEVSINRLEAGTGLPYVHAHKKNEELYLVVAGHGTFYVDGEEFPIREGSLIRVAPAGARSIAAGEADLYYLCIQAEVGSLSQATLEDGMRIGAKASWM